MVEKVRAQPIRHVRLRAAQGESDIVVLELESGEQKHFYTVPRAGLYQFANLLLKHATIDPKPSSPSVTSQLSASDIIDWDWNMVVKI